MPQHAIALPTDLHHLIGERVAGLVPDGATLQMGIGAIPNAALAALTTRRGLRVWTEMFSDGMLGLMRAGALADAPITTSFAAGSPELYQWLVLCCRAIHCMERRLVVAISARAPCSP